MRRRVFRTGWAVVAVLALVTVIHLMKYRSWPGQPPHWVSWCEMGWEREDRVQLAPPRMYFVARVPPLVGTRLYSPYTAAQRRQSSTGPMADACGGELYARKGHEVVPYEMAPEVPH